MAYVDLNPLRAGIAQTPESSNYTSVQARVETELPVNNHRRKKSRKTNNQRRYDYNFARLKPFIDSEAKSSINIKDKIHSLPFKLKDYMELVDASARMARTDKKHMDSSLPPIFERLEIKTDARWWASAMSGRSTAMASARQFAHAMGSALNLTQFKERVKQQTETWRQQALSPGKQPPS
ncbi:hypothetical protein [Pelagibaculum spongiae]|uniref:Transposase n=1 Tax=Pelagibaculum spongiae TaxID=2080658 RepID=A0A2V1GX67_9GAMM|nr:hypothetical protein [Pelagibaculum spongiae]PVZ68854.1 hypothetical protein DC094_11405 [Pelagibaculum spongiae]